jgi:hypothetical protein
MTKSQRGAVSSEETISLLKRCTEEKTNKAVAKIADVAESRISEGKKGKWRLSQEQKDKLINEFGFEQLHKGRYILVQRAKSFESMLSNIKVYDLFIKTEEYFTSEPFKEFLTDINIDALLEHSTAKDWFAYICSQQQNIMSQVTSRVPHKDPLSKLLGTKATDIDEDLRATKCPPICINYSAEHDLDKPPKFIDEQQERSELHRCMFNLCKDYFEGSHHEYDSQFWTRMYLLCYLKDQGANITDLLAKTHDERSEISTNEIVISGRTVCKENGQIDLHSNQLINSLLNETWDRQTIENHRLNIEPCTIDIELLITDSSRYFLLVNLHLPSCSGRFLSANLQHTFLIGEIDKSKIIDELIAIYDCCGIRQDPYEIKHLLAKEGALISTAEYIY